MFTAGESLAEVDDETREYSAVAAADEAVVEEAADDGEFVEAAEDGELLEVVEDSELVEAVEDEAWDGDEYEEWEEGGEDLDDYSGEELEPEGDDEPEADGQPLQSAAAGEEKSPLDGLKVWFGEFRDRSRTLAAGLMKRIGEIRLPRHEINGQKVLAAAGIVAVALLIGAGGYLLGKGTGDDLDTARLEGEFAGKRDGAIAGATRGYAAGFRKGRDLAFRKSYAASYRRNYRRAYENAGMDPPRAKDIEVPKP